MRVSPKQMFLIDGIGAVLTALCLGVVLPLFHEHIGLPKEVLIAMGGAGVFYGIYSFSCFFFIRSRYVAGLKLLILANLLYCVASAAVVTFYVEQMTLLGLGYFALEVLVILGVVFLEMNVLKNHLSQGATNDK